MAFPTSPSNNQIHTENNRSFVYNSSLGVWDQVPNSPLNLHKEGIINYPVGHVIQVVRKSVYSYVDSSGTTNAWENDTNDLHINVTKGNLIIATVCGGMFNAGSAVTGYWRLIRFSEAGATANQDIWTSTAIGSNHTSSATVYHYASTQTASCIAAHTGEMLVKRGSDNSGSTGNTAWASDVSNYGPVHYHVMEIQQ